MAVAMTRSPNTSPQAMAGERPAPALGARPRPRRVCGPADCASKRRRDDAGHRLLRRRQAPLRGVGGGVRSIVSITRSLGIEAPLHPVVPEQF